jgi:hypothetical protein
VFEQHFAQLVRQPRPLQAGVAMTRQVAEQLLKGELLLWEAARAPWSARSLRSMTQKRLRGVLKALVTPAGDTASSAVLRVRGTLCVLLLVLVCARACVCLFVRGSIEGSSKRSCHCGLSHRPMLPGVMICCPVQGMSLQALRSIRHALLLDGSCARRAGERHANAATTGDRSGPGTA